MNKPSTFSRIVLLAVMLAGCASNTKGTEPIVVYANETGDTAIVVSWNCSRMPPNLLMVKGAVRDISAGNVQDVAIQVVGIGPDGGQISSGQGFTEEIILTPSYASPFKVAVNTAGTEKRFALFFSYRVGTTTYASPQQANPPNACPGL